MSLVTRELVFHLKKYKSQVTNAQSHKNNTTSEKHVTWTRDYLTGHLSDFDFKGSLLWIVSSRESFVEIKASTELSYNINVMIIVYI